MLKNLHSSITARIEEFRSHQYLSREQERAIGVLGALAVSALCLLVFLHKSTAPAMASAAVISAPSNSSESKTVVVDVEGKVLHPGVYTLSAGSRAIDALHAAGNALPKVDLSDINLAHLVADGEEIVVGAPKVLTSSRWRGSSSKKKSSATTGGSISINTATAAQLESLPGIGPVMAGRIISYRLAHGAFTALADLRNVSGMGAAKYQEIQSLIHL